MKNAENKTDLSILRQKVEDILKKKQLKPGSHYSEVDTLKLNHELEVHQIELEMQNEELMHARSTALEAAEKYIGLYDFAPSGLFTLSREGKILELNLRGSQMLGKERSLLKNSMFEYFISENTKTIFKLFLCNVFNGKVNESCEVSLSIKANLPVIVHINGSTNENGEQCLMTAIDITYRKQIEAELKLKNEELMELNAEKDRFFSIIAHDMRGPFSSLLGLTQMMVDELPVRSQDEIQKIAINMRNSAKNLFHLLENLLEWSRLKTGAMTYNPELFLLKQIAAESLEPVIDSAIKKEIKIVYDVPETLTVFADANMLAALFRNFVSNAVKFTPKGGIVIIEAKSLGNGWIEVIVKDMGIGMNSKILDDLFHIDKKANRLGTEGEPSSGLGLIICREFVEKHGGKIGIESAEGRGSTFRFTLPMNELH
jgi:signal transduction histidine kinase